MTHHAGITRLAVNFLQGEVSAFDADFAMSLALRIPGCQAMTKADNAVFPVVCSKSYLHILFAGALIS